MTRAALAAMAFLTIPVLTHAQPMPPGPPGDRHELRQDRRALADDRRDVFWTQQLLARFDDACARRDRRALAAVENEATQTLDRELREARFDLMKSKHEARRDRHEMREDAYAGDGRQMHDDRRELRDDRRDVRENRRDLFRVNAIRGEFWSLRGRLDRRSIDRKRALLTELVNMAHEELREDRHEMRDDRRDMMRDEHRRY